MCWPTCISRTARKINRPLLLMLGLGHTGPVCPALSIFSDSLVDARSIALFFASLLLLPALAWFTAAMLLVSNLLPGGNSKSSSSEENEIQPAPEKVRNRYTLASLALSAALIFVSLQHLYWIFAWDATTDAIGMILQIPVMWIAVSADSAAGTAARRQRRWVGVVTSALFLAAVITVIQLAMRIDFRQVTEERADQVSQALERRFLRLAAIHLRWRSWSPGTFGQYPSQ